ncbi:MAG: radical SAM protein [Chloroflexi bacterium]|nr:radical SAM protein [Chloroflexota bacterium]
MVYQSDLTYRMNLANVSQFSFEMGPIRPPSEGKDQSLLIRATRNCPWNRCLFCSTYKDQKFEYRSVEEIKADIDVARFLHDEIKAASWKFGLAGKVSNELIRAIIQGNPEIYGNLEQLPLQNLGNVANWIAAGAKTVFLQDADTLIMRTPELLQVLKYLKENFPTLERITSYARAKSCLKKTPQELNDLHQAGISRLHIGLESGNDQVLEFVQKGVNQEQHIIAGKKVVESGISLSEYVMPGLGGRKWSEIHALDSAKALSEINPDFIRMRSLVVRKNSPLFLKQQEGQFEPLSEDELVGEIAIFIENLNCSSYVISDQMSNLLFEVEGQLPRDKERILGEISKYQQKPPMEKLKFRLNRRLRSYLGAYGVMSQELNRKVAEALESIQKEAPEAESKTNQAISALKDEFI